MTFSTPPIFVQKLREGEAQKIVFYGTSLTAGGGWTDLLVRRLNDKFPGHVQTVNTAMGGQHSTWGLENFAERVIAHSPEVLFMEFSVNDAVDRFAISLEQSRSNLATMIETTRTQLPGCEIILQVMNPVIDRPPGHPSARTRLPEYQQLWREAGRQHDLRVIDHMPAWTDLLDHDEAHFRALVPDGLHPDKIGYQEIVQPTLFAALHLD